VRVVDVLVVVVALAAEVDVAALAIAAPPPATAPIVASAAISGRILWVMFVCLLGCMEHTMDPDRRSAVGAG